MIAFFQLSVFSLRVYLSNFFFIFIQFYFGFFLFVCLFSFSICCYYLIDSFPIVTLVELKFVRINEVDWYFVPTGSNDGSSSHFSVII